MEPGCSNSSLQRILRSNSVTKQATSGNQRTHSSEGPSFIKLLGRDFFKQLQIPNEFIVNFNGHVPHRFILESAMTKEAWRVEVQEEKDGAIYFREGWADFVKAHLLEDGNFLLFEYEEQSILVVKVYNKDGCQKMVLDTHGGKNDTVKMTDFEEEDESDASDYEPTSSNSRQENTKSIFTRKDGNGKHRTLSKPDRTTRVLFAENDMTFSITMNNSKKYQFRQQMIPKSISLAHNLMKKDSVTLEDATGNCWPVRLSILSDGRVRLGFGWTTFLEGNEVAAGDLLSFKFVTDDLLKVQVTKTAAEVELHSKDTNSPTGANLSPNFDCEIDKANACNADVNPPAASINTSSHRKRRSSEGIINTSSHRKRHSSEGIINTSSHRKRRSSEGTSFSFSFLWGPTSTPGAYMHVPRVVTEAQKLMNKDTVVLRDPVGKCWPIEVRPRGDGRVALTRGWSDFCKGQAFKVGDSLNFKFISEYVAQVEINRGDQLKSPFKVEEGIINLQ